MRTAAPLPDTTPLKVAVQLVVAVQVVPFCGTGILPEMVPVARMKLISDVPAWSNRPQTRSVEPRHLS